MNPETQSLLLTRLSRGTRCACLGLERDHCRLRVEHPHRLTTESPRGLSALSYDPSGTLWTNQKVYPSEVCLVSSSRFWRFHFSNLEVPFWLFCRSQGLSQSEGLTVARTLVLDNESLSTLRTFSVLGTITRQTPGIKRVPTTLTGSVSEGPSATL